MKMTRKNIWMQFLTIGNFIFFLIFACNPGEIDRIETVSYLYKNNTGISLIMEVYNTKNELIKTYSINHGAEIVTNTTKSEAPNAFYFESFEDKIGSSVTIKFDDNKCLFYNKNNLDRIFDIKRYDNYSQDLIQKSEYTLIYIFKNEDYAESLNCN